MEPQTHSPSPPHNPSNPKHQSNAKQQVPKEFSFICRTRKKLPSSKQLQSFIFMKQHTISRDKKHRKAETKKKRSIEKLKKVMKKYSQKNAKKENQPFRSEKTAQTKTNGHFFFLHDNFNETVDTCPQSEKQRKKQINSKLYQPITEEKRRKKIQPKYIKKLAKKKKQKRKKKRKNTQRSENYESEDEFIVVEDIFVKAKPPSVRALEEKLLVGIQRQSQNEFLDFINFEKNQTKIIQKNEQAEKGGQNSWKQIYENSSQIRKSHQIKQSEKMIENLIDLREKTAEKYLNNHKKILYSLLELDRIDTFQYISKLNQTQNEFQHELVNIQNFKQILFQSSQRIKELEEKINIQNEITKNISSISPSEITQHLFPTSNSDQVDNLAYERQSVPGKIVDISFSPSKCSNQIKLQEENQAQFSYYNDKQIAKSEIDRRQAKQLGIIVPPQLSEDQINTSLVGIHNFLTRFIKFYAYFFQDRLIEMLNTPYGKNIEEKLQLLQREEKEKMKEKGIIGEEILSQFHAHSHEQIFQGQLVNEKMIYERYHQRAILDALNEGLNTFRPYFQTNGIPFPWKYDKIFQSFYLISEENIEHVLSKVQYRILRQSSYLCGLICECLSVEPNIHEGMDLQSILQEYKNSLNGGLLRVRDEKLDKKQSEQIKEELWSIEDDEAKLLIQISDEVYEEVMGQITELLVF